MNSPKMALQPGKYCKLYMNPNEAIILAGGMGTRLKSVVSDLPKPMAPIDDKPFLEYMLSVLSASKIAHVVLSVGYKYETIEAYFGDSFAGMKITYAVENEPLGTGGAIKYALSFIDGNESLLLNGDTFFNINLNDLREFYFAHKPDIAMSVRLMYDFSRYGTVELNVSNVTGFISKQPVKQGYINGGVYMIKKNIFGKYTLPEKFSFEIDFLEKYVSELKICAMKSTDYFIDIGIPEDYKKARTELPGLLKS